MSYEFYNLELNKFEGCPLAHSNANRSNEQKQVEGFVENMDFSKDTPSNLLMTDSIANKNLQKNYVQMQIPSDKHNDLSNPLNIMNPYGYDLSSNVVDPRGYGYMTPSLDEVRSKDSTDLVQQESATFVMGAIAGVSVIVLGILLTSGVVSDASSA